MTRVTNIQHCPTGQIGRCLAQRALFGEALNACDFDREAPCAPGRRAEEVLVGLADDVPVV